MASGPITWGQIDRETMETVIDIIFLGSKITVDGDCSLEIKTLAPWKKSNDKPRLKICVNGLSGNVPWESIGQWGHGQGREGSQTRIK